MKSVKTVAIIMALLTSLACGSLTGGPSSPLEELQTEVAGTSIALTEQPIDTGPIAFTEGRNLRLSGADSQDVVAMDLSEDGTLLAAAGYGGSSVVLFETETTAGRQTAVVSQGVGLNNGVAVDADSAYAAVRDATGGLLLVEARVGTLVADEAITDNIERLASSGSGSMIGLTSDGMLVEVELPNGDLSRQAQIFDQSGSALALLSDGSVLAAGDGEVKLLSADWDEQASVDLNVAAVAAAPNGSTYAVLASGDLYLTTDVSSLSQDATPDAVLCPSAADLAFSANGSLVASVGPNCPVQVVEVATGDVIYDTGDTRGGRGIEFSPDLTSLYAGTSNAGVQQFDIDGLQPPLAQEPTSEGPVSFSIGGSSEEATAFCNALLTDDVLENIFDQAVVERRAGEVDLGAQTNSCSIIFSDGSAARVELQTYANALEASSRYNGSLDTATIDETAELITGVGTVAFYNTADQSFNARQGPYFVNVVYEETNVDPRFLVEELGAFVIGTLPDTGEEEVPVVQPSIAIVDSVQFCEGIAMDDDFETLFGSPPASRSAVESENNGFVTTCIFEFEDGNRIEVLLRLYEDEASAEDSFLSELETFVANTDFEPVVDVGQEALFFVEPEGYFSEAGEMLLFHTGPYRVSMAFFNDVGIDDKALLEGLAQRIVTNLAPVEEPVEE